MSITRSSTGHPNEADEIMKVLGSGTRPKEKITVISSIILDKEIPVQSILDMAGSVKGSDRGTLIESLETVAKVAPSRFEGSIDPIVPFLKDDLPRVRWEASRILANLARSYPGGMKKAIPELMDNTFDEGTVVRWSAALALTEIAKADPESSKEMDTRIEGILARETNNGVRNVYIKYSKSKMSAHG